MAPHANAADAGSVEITQLTVERSDEGVFVNANLRIELPSVVQDALIKGIPIHFVVEADLFRERWYWADRKVASGVRHLRVTYQALSRRWRLQTSPQPIGNAGQGVAVAQQFDSLDELLTSLQRIHRWQIGSAEDVDPQARHNLDFRFRLDVSLLPRPVQFGVAGQSDWALGTSRTQRVIVEPLR